MNGIEPKGAQMIDVNKIKIELGITPDNDGPITILAKYNQWKAFGISDKSYLEAFENMYKNLVKQIEEEAKKR